MSKFYLSLCLLLCSGSTIVVPPHALYLSVVQIDHTQPEPKAEMLIKVFADDLESVLRAAYGDQCRRSPVGTFCTANSELINAYFLENFSCIINDQAIEITYLHATQENDVYWLKFSLQVPVQWSTVAIEAPFFMEIFSTQSNIIQLLHGAEKRFGRLTKGHNLMETKW